MKIGRVSPLQVFKFTHVRGQYHPQEALGRLQNKSPGVGA